MLCLALLVGACGSSKNLCDTAQLSYTCGYHNGQCVEFTGLSTADLDSIQAFCAQHNGNVITGPCPTAGREGTCDDPPGDPNSGVTCSPHAVIEIRYFPPFDAANAQSLCNNIHGTWTPG